MKILVINNNTVHMPSLSKALAGFEIEVREYRPGLDFSCADKDLVILSGGGGEGLEIDDEHKPGKLWYADEMKFVRTTDKPVLGICMGLEVIARAFGQPVKKMTNGVNGFAEFTTTPAGKKILGRSWLKQYEAHDWHVPQAPEGFEILARSASGIEIIKHQSRKLMATQFHPEKGGTLSLKQIIASYIG